MKIDDLFESEAEGPKDTQFYKEYGGNTLFIGIETRMEDGVLKSPRGFNAFKPNDRIPRDTFIVYHTLANHLSQKKLGIKIRQGIFSSRSSNHASIFGDTVYRFIPNDGYEMYYHPKIEDFTVHSLQGNGNQKQARVIEYKIRTLMRVAFDHSYQWSNKYIAFLRDNYDRIDYDSFNVGEISKKFFDEYFDTVDLNDAEARQKFYNMLDLMWDEYYRDIEYYVDGLKKVNDVNEVDPSLEIITFPHNGFWLL